VPSQGWGEQGAGGGIQRGIWRMVTLFVGGARQLADVLRLQAGGQPVRLLHPFQKGAGALGVFGDPVAQLAGHRERGAGE